MKNSKFGDLIKDTFIFAIGNIGSKFILFFMLPLYTNCLTTEQYGIADLIDTLRQFVVPIASLVIVNALIRFGLSKYENKEDVFKCSFIVTMVACFFTVLITPLFGLYDAINDWKFYLCIYSILDMVYQLFHDYLKVIGNNLQYAMVSIIQTLLFALLNVVFLVLLDLGIKGYLLSIFISYSVCAIICIVVSPALSAIKHGKLSKPLLKKMLSYSVPLILNNISWWVVHSSDKVMIEIMISASALGIYTVASKIPSLVNVFASIFQQSWSISAIKEIESTNDKNFYSKVFQTLHTLVFGAVIILVLLVKPFMSFYVGNDFVESWIYIPLLLVGAAFSAISTFYGSLYAALKKSMNNMITTFSTAVINLVLNYIFILKIGIWGAVIGTVVAYQANVIMRMIDCSRYVNFDKKLPLFSINGLVVTVQAVLVSFGYDVYIVSVLAAVIFILINRRTIRNIFLAVFSKIKSKIR